MRMLKKNSKQNKHSFQLKPICAAVLLVFSAQNADANPVGGAVVNGQASFNTTGSTLTVTNTPGTIINWQGFSIQQNEITRFAQQSASSAVLNRVITNNPSLILGTLQSNGRVFLVNPSGIVFGTGSTVDVAGLVATTQNLSNADFQAGRYQFTQVPGAQNISNAGNITAQSGGEIYLIAPNVENSGVITAPNGEILLVAGHEVQLVNSLDPNLRVNITAPAGNATNVGQLIASAGRLGLFGAVARNTGTVSADSAVAQGGKIVLRASQRVEAGGTISAQGTGGGEIKVLADMQSGTVNVTGTLDASAPVSGNGGFIETSAAHVQVADTVRVSTAALNGSSGTWLIDPSDFTIALGNSGTITSGTPSGDISGQTLSTALGSGNVTILSSQGSNASGYGDINVNDAVSWSANLLTLSAARDININAVMTASNTASLAMNTAYANGADSAVVGGTVKVGMNAAGGFTGRVDFFQADGITPRSGTGFLTINGAGYTVINDLGAVGSITTTDLQGMSGNLSGNYALGNNIDASATATWNPDGLGGYYGFTPVGSTSTAFSGQFNGLGHTISYLAINNSGIDNVGLLGYINSSARVSNVAMANASITGHLEAGALVGYNNYGVVTNSSSSGSVNSFGSAGGLVGENYGTVSYSISTANVQCSDINVCGGGLVGWNNYGTISYSTATGNVSGSNEVGGLVGLNQYGTISNSAWTPTAGNTVSGNTSVGGLVGSNYYATITGSSASGAVTGGNYVGGLVGYNDFRGSISSSTASGAVTGNSYVGGLAGANYYNIDSSSASGMVSGSSYVGGLVGWNNYTYSYIYYASSYGNISNSYATGNVTGSSNLGGLVGRNDYSTSISASHASGNVTGSGTSSSNLGGLVGDNFGTISNSYVSIGSVTGSLNVGGLVGSNTGTLSNSHYDINGVTINGGNTVTLGGLYNNNTVNSNGVGQYTDWLNGGLSLNIANYTSTYGGSFGMLSATSYTISDTNGMKDMLGFADTPGLTFTLTASVALPTGYSIPYLAANFDGGSALGYNITGLNISLPNDNLGLFNHIASGSVVSNVSLVDASVSGRNNVGALAGWNEGTINNSSVSASTTGGVAVTGVNSVGGLVGYNSGTINNSYVSSGVITASRDIGGLVGIDYGVRTNSFFNVDTVTTNGVNNVTTGGLYNTQFTGWISGGLTPLVITSYSSSLALQGDGSYGIGTIQGMKDMLAFADDPAAYNFSLTGNFSLVQGFNVPKLVGSFNGHNFTLSNLNVNLPNSNIGLFGVTSTSSVVSNLNLANANVIGYNNVGVLVGNNYGNIQNTTVTGSVSVYGVNNVGGLVGQNNGGAFTTAGALASGVISNSYVSGGSVTGINSVGGLVGYNYLGNIDNSSVANTLVSGASDVGGLVGYNQSASRRYYGVFQSGMITNSSVDTVTVTSTGGSSDSGIGGLVGLNFNGDISGSYALSPTVNGGLASMVGGLVGRNKGDAYTTWTGVAYAAVRVGTISNSYVIGGTVSSSGNDVGGLVGNNFGALIDTSYVDSVGVTGYMNVGGLVGNDSGEGFNIPLGIIQNSHATNTQVTGDSHVGGLIGHIGLTSAYATPPSYDAVVNSYVSGGTVTSNALNTSATGIGGLVGYNSYGNISGSYVTNGTVVNGGLAHNVGGLVGYNIGSGSYSAALYGRITASYVSGGTVTSGTVVSGDYNVGGLVGENAGYIGSSYVTGTTVNGTRAVGGLVGNNSGYTTNNYVSNVNVNLSGSGSVSGGGLVGYNNGVISNSYVDGGVVSASSGWEVGGLVGYNSGTIKTSYVVGGVGGSVSGSGSVGGLVGYNSGSIDGSYVSGGSVTGSSGVGGLVGYNSGTISGSYVSDASVIGVSSVGGLVGYNGGSIKTSYVVGGSVSGSGSVGGLVGYNSGSISMTYAASGSVSGGSNVGGLVGNNDYLGYVSDSYWDINTTLQGLTNGFGTDGSLGVNITNVSGLNTLKSMSQSSYTNFDFVGTWWMSDTNTRPFLQSEWTTNITNAHQLQLMDMNATKLAASYTLANNIDLAPALAAGGMWDATKGFVPIGNSVNPFVGTFDGQSHTISNLTINRPTESYVGLFGYANSPSSIIYVGLVSPVVTGLSDVGALAGFNGGNISNSYVNGGTVKGQGPWSVGGLVGGNAGNISGSYVSGGTVIGNSSVGGLVGYNSGSIDSSYVSGGSVTGSSGVGGLVGYNGSIVTNNFWDTALIGGSLINGIGYDTTALGATNAGATGLTSTQMMQQSSFTGWDFTNTWRIYDGHTTPLLKSFLTPVTVTASGINGNFTKSYDGVAWNAPVLGTITYSDPAAAGLLNESTPFGAPVTNAGSYEMLWSGQQGYDITYTAGGMLTINPVALTLLSLRANDATKTYGTTLNFAGTEFGLTSGVLVGTDNIGSVTLSSAGAINTANAGAYTITPSNAVFSVGNASNYTITYVNGVLTVNPAPLTVTADVLSKIYGNADPALTYTTSGLLFSDTLSGSLSRVAGQNVGSYAINQATLNNSNYAITYNSNNLSITQRSITVAASATTKVYGNADPGTFTVAGGLAPWDTNSTAFTGALSHTGGENVVSSPYPITQGTLAASSNYSASYIFGATLTITPALLTVVADSYNKVLGTPDPLFFDYIVSGLRYSDTAASTLTGALSRNPGDTIGSYNIGQNTLALNTTNFASTNYTLSYVPGIFNILAPTVVQEITQISLLLAPKDGNALTSAEEEKRLAEELAASEMTITEGGGGTTEPLRVCR